MAPILAYWDARGIANPIRMLLHHVNERFVDKRYGAEDADEWFKEDKPALGETLHFPNLPYYIDGLVQLSQTKVILAYLGRKHKLDANTEAERLRMHLAMEFLADMKNAISKIAYPGNAPNAQELSDTLYKEYATELPARLAQFAKFLKAHKWVAGDKLTYADFYVYDELDSHRVLFEPKYVNAEPVLAAYLKQFEELSGVKQFLGSEEFAPLPLFAPYAKIGNSKDYKPKSLA